jgi:hypothetical protein
MKKPTVFTSPSGEFTISAPNGLCPACVETATQKHRKTRHRYLLLPASCSRRDFLLECDTHQSGESPNPSRANSSLEPILAESLELAHAMKQTH